MKDIAIDIIIPCAKKDIDFIPKVIKYIRKNIVEAGTIYIITNFSNISRVDKLLHKQSFPDIVILNENSILDGLSFSVVKQLLANKEWYIRQGWYFQQFLKLGFALTKYANNYYLSWDADTLPLTKLHFIEDGHPIFTIKKEYHPAYFETMQKLIGIGKSYEYSFIAEHMLFKTSIVKELIEKISNNSIIEGENWIEKCINACEFSKSDIYKEPYFSEFETYGTYASISYPELYKTRKLNSFRGAGYIRGRNISDKMIGYISLDLDIASFEYGATPPFPYNIGSWVNLHLIPKITKIKNMPIKRMPRHIFDIINRRFLRI